MNLLIDGDVVAYRAGFAVEKTKYLVTAEENQPEPAYGPYESMKEVREYWPEDNPPGAVWTRKEVKSEEEAILCVEGVLNGIRERYPSGSPVIFLSPSVGNFREGIATRAKYKGNRDGAQKPVHFKAIQEYLYDKWEAITAVGQEADDEIGIRYKPGDIICSIDKDLLQIPGTHYNFATKEQIQVTPKEAALNFWVQVLSGDATDNVPGLVGVGAITAKRALSECRSPKDCWEVVKAMYAQKYGAQGEEFALETARLVKIRRKPGEIWRPPTAAVGDA